MALSHRNNFDLIRLFAASQVMINHGLHHLGLLDTTLSTFSRVFNFLPGVPIFFFISGFLVSASYARSRTWRSYALNRSLRIFPALWLCTALAILVVWLVGYFDGRAVPGKEFIAWVLGQISVVQFYNPGFMRDFGVGALNGSLWTISVELQFYVMVPILFLLFPRKGWALWAVFAVFVAINLVFAQYLLPVHKEHILLQLFSVTFAPWFAMFMLGHIAHRYWEVIERLVTGQFLTWLAIYAILVALGIWLENLADIESTNTRLSGNRITILWFLPLSGLVLAAAFTKPTLAYRLTRDNDISYGIYIWHMPIINLWLYLAAPKTWVALFTVFAIVSITAYLSWRIFEAPALKLKHATLFRR